MSQCIQCIYHLNALGEEQMLGHAANDDAKEEPRVTEELGYGAWVRYAQSHQRGLQLLDQLFVYRTFLAIRRTLRHENVL